MGELFNKQQLEQISAKQMDIAIVEQQLKNFETGFPFLKTVKPATINDGILALTDTQEKHYITLYENNSKSYQIVKFVPASGAASRMFKDLFQFVSKLEENGADIEVNIENIKTFFEEIKDFAFYNDLKHVLKNQEKDIEKLVANKQYLTLLNTLLTDTGLNYGNLPKGLLKFHTYEKFSRTPVEEHFVEAALYATQGNQRAQIHFTVSPEHIVLFLKEFESIESYLEEKYKINFDATYSVQKPATDTIAVDMKNNPFIETNDEVLFRPGGHGALLENLNDLDAEIVFVKNIDNVVPDHLKDETVKYKKILGGLLIETKDKIFTYLNKYEDTSNVWNEKLLNEIQTFIEKELYYKLPKSFAGLSLEDKKEKLFKVLNRPVRICGIVKNEGEPGGGPFWVEMEDGALSLQIAETSQIDLKNIEQRKIMEQSTHFNPVDLVCYKKDYKGNNFNLLEYRDPSTGFVTKKSKDGKDLKAQELPGLWNGSMAFWNTLFIEVPLITFNPVKTVNDLLRTQHQREKE